MIFLYLLIAAKWSIFAVLLLNYKNARHWYTHSRFRPTDAEFWHTFTVFDQLLQGFDSLL